MLPPNACPIHSHLAGGGRESPEAVQALLSNSRNTSALSTVLQPQMQSTAPYRLLWSKLTPSKQHPLQIFIYDLVFILKCLFNMANTEVRLYHLIVSHCPWNPFLKSGIMFVAFPFLGITVVLRKRLCIAVISWDVSSLSFFWTWLSSPSFRWFLPAHFVDLLHNYFHLCFDLRQDLWCVLHRGSF